jgi:hypothetical protein
MPDRHSLSALRAGDAQQETVAADTGGFFNAEFILPRVLPNVFALAEKRQTKPVDILAEASRLGSGTLTQGVVEMPNEQSESALYQATQQAEAVRPA